MNPWSTGRRAKTRTHWAPEVTPESRMEVTAGSITIQHVDTLNVYTVSGWNQDAGEAPGIDGLRARERPAGG